MSAHVAGLLILVRADIVQRLRDIELPCAARVAAEANDESAWSDVADEVCRVFGGHATTMVHGAARCLAISDISGAAAWLRTIHWETADEWETRVRALVPAGT